MYTVNKPHWFGIAGSLPALSYFFSAIPTLLLPVIREVLKVSPKLCENHLTNKKAKTVLCSVKKHARK